MTTSSAGWSRRQFIGTAAVLATGCAAINPAIPEIIDCHTHFYDPTRPEGVSWPSKNETELYRRVLPSEYQRLARPLGITGTVVLEASSWLNDNEWVLGLARSNPFIRGFVGNLPVGEDNFATELKRLSSNPRFRGIRLRDVSAARLGDSAVLRDLKLLARDGFSLDVNGGPDLLPTFARLGNEITDLRIIIDHVANVRVDGKEPPQAWKSGMEQAAKNSNMFCKVSGLVEGSGRRKSAPSDVEFYRPVLDHVVACFGEDRVVYGSNWPVSALFADLATVHSIVSEYFRTRGETAVRKVFSGNCRRFYRPA